MTSCDLPPRRPPALPADIGPDEPRSPFAYCAELASFLRRRADIGTLILTHVLVPTNRVRDATLLAAITFIRGEAFRSQA